MSNIAVVFPTDYLETVPAVRNTIILLAQNGFNVEVFIYKANGSYPDIQFHDPNVIVHYFPFNLMKFGNILRFTFWAYNICRRNKFQGIIGIDPPGLLCATIIGYLLNIPWIYYSLELIISSDPVRMYKYYKPFELWCSRYSSLIVIQDEIRAQLMAEDNRIPLDRFAFLPNSPLGPASRSKTDYFHKRFCIKETEKILLHSGSTGSFTMVNDLIQLAHNFPENWKLIIHDRSNFGSSRDLPKFIETNKVKISKSAVPYSQLRDLVSSADVGIGLYNLPESPNVTYLCKSSGKLSHYLRCGLPIIVSKLPWWDEKVRYYHSGISISSPSEITSAAKTIFDDYEYFSQGAINHFEQELRFEPAFYSFLQRLRNIL